MTNADEVVEYLERVQQLPLMRIASAQGLAYRRFLANTTGLSEARLSKRDLSGLRASTLTKIQDHAHTAALEHALRAGWSQAEFASQTARFASPQLSGAAAWTGLAMSYEGLGSAPLPHLVDTAVSLDRRLTALQSLAAVRDLTEFQRTAMELASEFDFLEDDFIRRSFAKSRDWPALDEPLKALLGAWVADFDAALDAEWGNLYCPTMHPTTLLQFVLPRCDALQEGKELTWRAFTSSLRRPVRRFLELIYSMQHRKGRGEWPQGPPGPRVLAASCAEEESSITNYFDGTKKLRMSASEAIWTRLSEHFSTDADGFPHPLAMAAIWLQRGFVVRELGKAKTLIFPGNELHHQLWERHRMRLQNATAGAEPWPDWLTA